MGRSRKPAPQPPVPVEPAHLTTGIFAILASVLVLFAVVAYNRNLGLTFIGDDYVFLDRALREPFTAIASPSNTDFGWYRPWSRDLHFWALARLTDLSPLAFRMVGVALWTVALSLYFSIAAEASAWPAALLATLGVASLALWGTPLLWISGSQDLWMLVFAMSALKLHARGRSGFAALAFALALLSKETAAVMPMIFVAWSFFVARSKLGEALRRAFPSLGVLLIWLVVHPTLRSRFLSHHSPSPEAAVQPHGPALFARAAGALINLDRLPSPLDPLATWVTPVVLSTLILILGGAWLLRRRASTSASSSDSSASFRLGATWTMLGTAPVFLPTVGWHAYYVCLGTLGAWLVLGSLLARRPVIGLAVIGALALLRGAQVETPSWDWGDVWYQRRASQVVSAIHAELKGLHPTLPHHTRIYFGRIPNNVGLVAGKSPAVRVWYRDSTLSSDFFSSYRARAAGEAAGPDLFFRFDSLRAIVPVGDTGEPVPLAMRRNPEWLSDQLKLAYLFLEKGDPAAAGRQFELIAQAPGQEDAILFAGVCWREAGDGARAESLFVAARKTLGRDSTHIVGVVADLTATMPRFPASPAAPPAGAGR